ncbi:peptidase associated/transthyretin-like domain-containing protein [Pedobacter sp.]
MKFLIFLLLTTPALAQTIFSIKDENKAPISGASVFLMGDENKLIAISDSIGTLQIKLIEKSSYLIHLIGYEDKICSNIELASNQTVVLKSNIYQLNEIVVPPVKLKRVKLINKPENWSFGESNNVKTTFERVTPVLIENEGYLRRFTLFTNQNIKGEVRIFRFIIHENDNGIPGKSVINKNVIGAIKDGKMIFDLDSLGLFLNSGSYYIGYETQNNGNFSNHAKKLETKKGTYLEYPMIFIKGKSTSDPKAFYRSNLKNWVEMTWSDEKAGKKGFNDFAYELEMDVNR